MAQSPGVSFHLACDATSDAAVRTLRQRKRGEEKPLAVMVKSLDVAEALAIVGDEARRLLTSVERPIVVLPKRQGHGLAPSVAPHNRMVGLFLPYSPLHHLRLAEAARPLVMTSGCLCVPPEVELATRHDQHPDGARRHRRDHHHRSPRSVQ